MPSFSDFLKDIFRNCKCNSDCSKTDIVIHTGSNAHDIHIDVRDNEDPKVLKDECVQSFGTPQNKPNE